MAWNVSAKPERFDAAVDWFVQRTVLSSAEASALDTDSLQRSFWIGGGLQLSQVQHVFDEIGAALAKGEPFAAFKARVAKQLRDPVHAETVFRNATQRAYNAGRYQQMREPDVLKFRPFWMFDAILDGRTSTICKVRDKVILPATNPWWQLNIPPLHHRCRSSLRNLRKAEAERRGIRNVPPITPDTPGWGRAPDANPIWKPDPAKHDAALLAELERKAHEKAAKPKPPPPPESKPEHAPKFWLKEYAHLGEAAGAAAYGRAMQERGLDRSVAEVLAEAQRLKVAGHPVFTDLWGPTVFQKLQQLAQNRPLRTVGGEELQGLAGLIEHLRTVQPVGQGPLLKDLPHDARAFYALSASASIQQPVGWQLEVRPGVRAHADPRSQTILLATNDGASTAVHEWAHAIEFSDSRALARSLAFLRGRTAGESLEQLSTLTGDSGYRPDELARPDKFFSAYIGKDYGRHATEVTSMGYEKLMSFDAIRDLARRDREMLFFLLGQLAGQ